MRESAHACAVCANEPELAINYSINWSSRAREESKRTEQRDVSDMPFFIIVLSSKEAL